jgi:LppX_LprAFG lipoprotein
MRRAFPLLLLLLPLGLAACGGGSSNSSKQTQTPLASVRSAAHKTAQAKSEHMTVKGLVAVAGQAVTISGGGNFDNAKRAGAAHLDFSAGPLSGTIDEVLEGTTIYMRSPLFASSLPKGKTWMKLDLEKSLASRGIDFSALLSQNPAQSLDALAASGRVTKVGEEMIGGDSTTHYRGRIDVAKVPQGAKIQALARAAYKPYDVWVGNDDGYVHRLRLAYTIGTGNARQAVSFTMDFSDFGKAVVVERPPAAQTFDATGAAITGLGG